MRPNSLPWRIHRQSCLQRGAAPAQPLVQRILEQLRHVVHWGNPLSLGVAIVCECQGERMDKTGTQDVQPVRCIAWHTQPHAMPLPKKQHAIDTLASSGSPAHPTGRSWCRRPAASTEAPPTGRHSARQGCTCRWSAPSSRSPEQQCESVSQWWQLQRAGLAA